MGILSLSGVRVLRVHCLVIYFSLVCTTNPDLLRIGARGGGGGGWGAWVTFVTPRHPDSSWSSRKEIWVAKRVRERGGDEGAGSVILKWSGCIFRAFALTLRVNDVWGLTINVPVVYMAWNVMILMRANPLQGSLERGGPWKQRLFLTKKGEIFSISWMV